MNRQLYKLNPKRLDNVEEKRRNNSQKLKDQRHDRRTRDFNLRRNLHTAATEEEIVHDKTTERILALQRFIAQKEALKNALKQKARPPFIVGIPHHGSSPILREITNNQPEKAKKPIKTDPEFVFEAKKTVSLKKLTSPHTPTCLKRSAKKYPFASSLATPGTGKGTLGQNAKKHNLNQLSKNGNAGEEASVLCSQDDEIAQRRNPDQRQNSPVVENNEVMFRRTPRSDRKKIKDEPNVEELEPHHHTENVKTEEEPSVLPSQDIAITRGRTSDQQQNEPAIENHEAIFQRSRLDNETSRLLALAVEWEERALKEEGLSQDVLDEIDSVVGNTKLLTRDKFNQFRGLIQQYELEVINKTQKITNEDLNGFWDMMFLQVEKLIEKYSNLEILKNNGWVKVEPQRMKRKKKAPLQKLKLAKPPADPAQPEVAQPSTSRGFYTPTTEKHTAASRVVSSWNRARSNSPAAYIAMRISSATRLSITGVDQSNASSVTPKSILKNKIKTEPKSPEEGTILFGDHIFEDEEEIQEKVSTKTPDPEIRYDTTAQDSQTVTKSLRRSTRKLFKESSNSEKVSTKTPDPEIRYDTTAQDSQTVTKSLRRSTRKLFKESSNSGKVLTKTPEIRHDATAQDSQTLTKSLRRSTRKLFKESSNSGGEIQNNSTISKPRTSGKKFVLKPSRLIVDGIATTSSTATRSSSRLKDLQS